MPLINAKTGFYYEIKIVIFLYSDKYAIFNHLFLPRYDSFKDEGGIIAAKSKGVGHHGIDSLFGNQAFNRREVKFFHREVEMEVGPDDLVLNAKNRENGFCRTGSTGGMPGKRFGRANGRNFFSEQPFDSFAFGKIIVVGTGSVSVDIINLRGFKPAHFQCFFHGEVSADPVR